LVNKQEKILIIVPTRELAIQIEEEFRIFSRGLSMFSAICVGGSPIGRQISTFDTSITFVIGTPGRLKDLVEQGYIQLHTFRTVVLDEADRMLDMGFIHDMRHILGKLQSLAHTFLLSNTFKGNRNAHW
jgi:ATP-dependent RNA helicase RhlE